MPFSRFGGKPNWLDIHVDVGGNRARRIVERLIADSADPQPA